MTVASVRGPRAAPPTSAGNINPRTPSNQGLSPLPMKTRLPCRFALPPGPARDRRVLWHSQRQCHNSSRAPQLVGNFVGELSRDSAALPVDERAEPAIIATKQFRGRCYAAASPRATIPLFDNSQFNGLLRRTLARSLGGVAAEMGPPSRRTLEFRPPPGDFKVCLKAQRLRLTATRVVLKRRAPGPVGVV